MWSSGTTRGEKGRMMERGRSDPPPPRALLFARRPSPLDDAHNSKQHGSSPRRRALSPEPHLRALPARCVHRLQARGSRVGVVDRLHLLCHRQSTTSVLLPPPPLLLCRPDRDRNRREIPQAPAEAASTGSCCRAARLGGLSWVAVEPCRTCRRVCDARDARPQRGNGGDSSSFLAHPRALRVLGACRGLRCQPGRSRLPFGRAGCRGILGGRGRCSGVV